MPKTALIAVDVQNDYLPAGALGFPGSDGIIDPLVEYAVLAADIVIASRNLRPNTETLTPDCIKGTPGAKIVSELAAIVARPQNYVVTKGLDGQGGFSAFEAGTLRPLESLEDILHREKVTHVTVGGYWFEWCVAQTAFDSSALGYPTAIETSCTSFFPETPEDKRKDIYDRLERAGVICT